MGSEVTGLRETFVTFTTSVRLLSGVDTHVTIQGSRAGETLITVIARERFLASVASRVVSEISRLGGSPVALIALEGSLYITAMFFDGSGSHGTSSGVSATIRCHS